MSMTNVSSGFFLYSLGYKLFSKAYKSLYDMASSTFYYIFLL